MQSKPAKKDGFLQCLKPKCVRSVESALERLDEVTDETISLVKKNGYALEKARPENHLH